MQVRTLVTRDGSTPGHLALPANHPSTRNGSTPGLFALRANRPCVLACATSATGPSKRCFTRSSSGSAGLSQWRFSAQPKEAIERKPLSAYPAFVEHLAESGKQLPAHVRQAFDGYLQCGRLEHGFLRLRCDTCHAEHLLAFSCKRRGFCPSCGARQRRQGHGCGLPKARSGHGRPLSAWPMSRPGWSTRCCRSGRFVSAGESCIFRPIMNTQSGST